jgi:hypothetical protein
VLVGVDARAVSLVARWAASTYQYLVPWRLRRKRNQR